MVKHKQIALKQSKKAVSFDVDLAGGDGTLVLLLEKPIASLAINNAEPLEKGKDFVLKISVLDASGKAVKACLPLEVTLSDAQGRRLPGSGYHAAVNGVLELKEIAAANLQGNTVTVTAKCLASGKVVSKKINVK